MTHPMFDLPYGIWSSLAPAGIAWRENLAISDHECTIQVERRGRLHTLRFEFSAEDKEFHLVEYSKLFPKYVADQLEANVAFSSGPRFKEALQKQGETDEC